MAKTPDYRAPQRAFSIGLKPWQRALIERAAESAGLPPTVWSRAQLVEAARRRLALQEDPK